MTAAARSALLDPAALTRAEALGLLARKVVEGYRVGDHRSPFNGFAIEFSQHREYSPGDDPRHLDWKILGRSDKYYIKQYEQDTNYVAHLLLDCSASMAYGSGAVSKLHYARALVACLALVVLHQRDGVTASLFDDALRDTFARTDSPGRIHELCARLVAQEASRPGRLGACLQDYAARLRARGIVVIVSDLLDDPADFLAGLRRLALSKSEIVVFQVLDPHELSFPLDGTVKFVGLEDGATLQTSPADLRKAYLRALEAHQVQIRKACERCGAHYTLCDTGRPLAETLGAYLAFRQRC